MSNRTDQTFPIHASLMLGPDRSSAVTDDGSLMLRLQLRVHVVPSVEGAMGGLAVAPVMLAARPAGPVADNRRAGDRARGEARRAGRSVLGGYDAVPEPVERPWLVGLDGWEALHIMRSALLLAGATAAIGLLMLA